MRVHLGCDHAGYELKNLLAGYLRTSGHDVVDHGAHSYDAEDDYPAFCFEAAEAVVAGAARGSLGIVIGGSGNGEQIAANKVPGVRAALAWSVQIAQLAREHNDANVLSLGGRMQSLEDALAMTKVFLETPFSNDPRHVRRIEALSAYEDAHRA